MQLKIVILLWNWTQRIGKHYREKGLISFPFPSWVFFFHYSSFSCFFLKKRIAYFRESDYENAKKVFEEGKKSFSDQKLFKTWTLKCEAELDLIKQKNVKKETPKETKKETPKEIPKETVKEAVKESPKVTVKETPQETKKETPKETQKETPKVTQNETQKETSKENFKEIPKETVKETPKEIPKEVNEQSKPTKPTIKYFYFEFFFLKKKNKITKT